MPELADIFRTFQHEYYQKYGSRMLPSHRKAMDDIIQCRTPIMGGTVYECKKCKKREYAYHSCNNRHCPKCQNDQITDWVNTQQDSLLPVPYFLATFTLPEQFNRVACSSQKAIYRALFSAASYSLQKLARDKRFLGAHIGMLGILHTWTRDIRYHPHIHFLIPSGGLSFDKKQWIMPKYRDFFIHVKPLSRLFRGIFKQVLTKSNLWDTIPQGVWKKDWVVHIQPAGSGYEVIKYIAPYIRRIALSNNRIVKLEGRMVTFKYKENGSTAWKYTTLDAIAFMSRFLQHVLPKGFVKIRYYGFLAQNQSSVFDRIQKLLGCTIRQENTEEKKSDSKELRCRCCGGKLLFKELIPKSGRVPP